MFSYIVGLVASDYIKRLILLSVIKVSDGHCARNKLIQTNFQKWKISILKYMKLNMFF